MAEPTDRGSYGQFCPVAMAAEIVCSRWTALVLRELLCGTTRFNDLRRGVPRMSPTLLSKRLKELEEAGVIVAVPTGQAGVVDYRLTEAGEELRGVVESLGIWGQRWVESASDAEESRSVAADVGHAAESEDRAAAGAPLHDQVHLSGAERRAPVVVAGDRRRQGRSLQFDPGYEVDLYVEGSLYSMTSVWMGHSTLKCEVDAGKIELNGDKAIIDSMNEWLGLSPLAKAYRGKAA